MTISKEYWILRLSNRFHDGLYEHSNKHDNRSVHASTVLSKDSDDSLKQWIEDNIISCSEWSCSHPDDYPPSLKNWNMSDYFETFAEFGLKIFDINNRSEFNFGLKLIDSTGECINLKGRADYLVGDITSTIVDVQYWMKCVIEFQSNPKVSDCELQLQLYLVLVMNLRPALPGVLGVLVLRDGRCRAYKATRNGGNIMYEQNDTFHVQYIAEVIHNNYIF